ncbi:DUF3000 domain-containing protein [Acidipropionibacterium virtanenii]|uniref:DUF3000 domain-containing protein n=1 Tax=Acidipropionibacterium virtanenii TaxID=2057246 RepID=UPI003CCC5E12
MDPVTDFASVRERVSEHPWRAELSVSEIPAPTRIAPEALALEASVLDDGAQLGSGRLIILHDPAGSESWQGNFRLVTMARAEVDPEMATDPLLAPVARSWLTDSLDSSGAEYVALAGTATSVVSRPFGQLGDEPDENRVELRASWTPQLARPEDIGLHLAGWQDLLCHACGLPPLPEGVTRLKPRHSDEDQA